MNHGFFMLKVGLKRGFTLKSKAKLTEKSEKVVLKKIF